MTRRLLATCFAIACASVPAGAAEEARQPPPQPPFYRLREHQAEYAGPGRDEPPPRRVDEVLLGYFGPGDPAHPDGGDMWLAAQMAVDAANRQGGYRGKPFRIVARWSENPWGTGVAEVARMVYDENVWAIVGAIDGPSTHLAEQVVAKARLPLVSPASSDKTVNLANVPWMFSLLPGDHLQAPVVAAAVSDRVGSKPFVLVSAVDHDSRLFTAELRKCLTSRRLLPRYHFEHNGAPQDEPPLLARIVESKPDAVVLVAGAHQSARLLVGLRRRGFAGLVFGSATMGRRRFQQGAGDAAEGVLFPLLYDPQQVSQENASAAFCAALRSRLGTSPDYAAAHTYDAFRLLIAAVRKADLNRARIRDALEELSPWSGVTGTVTWDPQGSNTRAVSLGTIERGSPARSPQ